MVWLNYLADPLTSFAVGIWDTKENFFNAQADVGDVLEGVYFETLEDEARKLYFGETLVWV